ncbi:MAG: hypothetical protein UX75_C0042G0006, partial [Candidatus Moranbacteria bacterium GW2011_GWE2_47_10]
EEKTNMSGAGNMLQLLPIFKALAPMKTAYSKMSTSRYGKPLKSRSTRKPDTDSRKTNSNAKKKKRLCRNTRRWKNIVCFGSNSLSGECYPIIFERHFHFVSISYFTFYNF